MVWLAAGAMLAAMLAALLFSAPAKAHHRIQPGWHAWQLNPGYIRSGVPRSEQLVATRATRCTGGPAGGTSLLLMYLERWWPRGESWGIYDCRLPSLHSEGRAVDYHLDIRDAADRAAGHQILQFFLKTVSGRDAVMARRWGVQELIYDCIYWSPSTGIQTYYRCQRPGYSWTDRHLDHIHVGQNPFGAGGHTTAYTGYWPNH